MKSIVTLLTLALIAKFAFAQDNATDDSKVNSANEKGRIHQEENAEYKATRKQLKSQLKSGEISKEEYMQGKKKIITARKARQSERQTDRQTNRQNRKSERRKSR